MARMSHDRVHFTIRECFLQKQEIIDCLVETMGLDRNELRKKAMRGENLHVVCRPSQFARFVILRHTKYNQPNNMACLAMKLVVPDPKPMEIDVSENPNRVGYVECS